MTLAARSARAHEGPGAPTGRCTWRAPTAATTPAARSGPRGGGRARRPRPGRVWECSHVGGCRFAANSSSCRTGLYYGGVTPATAAALVEATEAGHVVPDLLRGRSSTPAAVQAAEHHARAADPRLGTGLDALRPLGSTAGDDGSVTVVLAVAATGRVLAVTVAQRPHAAPALLTCAASRPSVPMAWDLVSLVDRPA